MFRKMGSRLFLQWSFKTVLENETSPDKWRKSALDPTFQEKKKKRFPEVNHKGIQYDQP